jgi:hypothetical protein
VRANQKIRAELMKLVAAEALIFRTQDLNLLGLSIGIADSPWGYDVTVSLNDQRRTFYCSETSLASFIVVAIIVISKTKLGYVRVAQLLLELDPHTYIFCCEEDWDEDIERLRLRKYLDIIARGNEVNEDGEIMYAYGHMAQSPM